VKKVQEKKTAKFNVQALSTNDTIKENYRRAVKEKLALREEELQGTTVMEQWKVLKDVMKNAATKSVAFQ
jgi:hypothetical protein